MSWAETLGATDLFGGMPPDVLEELAGLVVHRRYRKGSSIFVQGEAGARCYAIATGAVRISAYHTDGREAVLAVLGPGDVFGELALFDDAPRSADASVIEDAELLSLDRDALHGVIAAHPALALALLRTLGVRLRRTNEALQEIALFDVPGRVARRLADLAEAHGAPTDDGTLIDLPLSQESLAQMVGATRESVNKALAGLVRRGLVSRQGRRYVVADTEKLRDRAR
jgi:CRP/FNR family transcriptional regulator, cyclic AMP receptor protein